MLEKVVSGGQSGVDQAALRAARAACIATGGWAPLGWATEDGPAPWLAGFGLVECPEPGYPARTRANVRDSDATVWFGTMDSPGFLTTFDAKEVIVRPWLVVCSGITRPSQVARWIRGNGFRVVNVAGNRESKAPGIGERSERFLLEVFRRLGRPPTPPIAG